MLYRESIFLTGFPGFIAGRLVERLVNTETQFFLLVQPQFVKKAMEEAISWDQLIYNEWSRNAWQLAKLFVEKTDALSNYKTLFS